MLSPRGHGAREGSALGRPAHRIPFLPALVIAGGLALGACGGAAPATPAASPSAAARQDAATTPAPTQADAAPATTAVAQATVPSDPQPGPTSAVDRSKPAAVVNGEQITFEQLDTSLEQRYGAQAIEEIITNKLIEQEAKKRNIAVSPAEVEQELKKAQASLQPGQSLEQAVQQQLGIGLPQFRTQLRTRLLFQKIAGPQVKVTDAEIKAYYDQNKQQFATPQELKLLRVVADDQKKAAAAAKELRGNAKLASVTEKYASKKPAFAGQSADLGFVQPQSLPPEVGAAIAALKKGQVSEPIPGQSGGFTVIKVEDTRGGEATPLAKVRGQVSDAVLQQKLGQFAPQLLGELRSKATITNQFQPAAQQPAQGGAAPGATEEVPPALQTPQG